MHQSSITSHSYTRHSSHDQCSSHRSANCSASKSRPLSSRDCSHSGEHSKQTHSHSYRTEPEVHGRSYRWCETQKARGSHHSSSHTSQLTSRSSEKLENEEMLSDPSNIRTATGNRQTSLSEATRTLSAVKKTDEFTLPMMPAYLQTSKHYLTNQGLQGKRCGIVAVFRAVQISLGLLAIFFLLLPTAIQTGRPVLSEFCGQYFVLTAVSVAILASTTLWLLWALKTNIVHVHEVKFAWRRMSIVCDTELAILGVLTGVLEACYTTTGPQLDSNTTQSLWGVCSAMLILSSIAYAISAVLTVKGYYA